PSETTIGSAAQYIDFGRLEEYKKQPTIGKPIHNTGIYIMGQNMELMPVGVPGELCIAGDGVSRGYLNRPELTAERFTKAGRRSPSFPGNQSPITNNGLYRTGDLARRLPDGRIEFLGRIDHQVKLRGYRVEPGEIETRMLDHGAIKEAAVIIKENKNGDKYICAYYVSATELTHPQLRGHLAQHLPEYMLPAYYIPLEKMPLNPNGKVERKALPEPQETALAGAGNYIAPRGIIEKRLTGIWQNVLGRERVGIEDNFFEIGGDSIKTIQIISQLKKTGYKLKMSDIFRNPRISELAAVVKKIERKADQSVVTGNIPLTPVQRRFLEKQSIGKHHYNHSVMLALTEGFDEEAVKLIFTKIQEHHDAFRVTYKEEGETIIQTNHGLEYPFSLEGYDLRNLEEPGTSLRQKAQQLQSSINLETGPLMKLGLFGLPEGNRLLIVIHHLVIDGVSWRILFEDISTLYNQYKKEETLQLPLKTDSFRHWAEKLEIYAGSETLLKEKAYWREMESIEVAAIKKDFETEENNMKTLEALSVSLDERETNLLLAGVNEAFGTETNDILLTALGLAFKQSFGGNRMLIALEGHGREEIMPEVDINRTVGWFTGIYPVIFDIVGEAQESAGDGKTTDKNQARRIIEVKETLRRVPAKGVGYGILKHLTHPEQKEDMAFNLKPQMVFNYLGQFDEDVNREEFGLAKEPVENPHSPNIKRNYLLDVTGIITGGRLEISISYNTLIHKTETIEALLNQYKKELSEIITFCTGREERKLTPFDMTYKNISIDQLRQLQERYAIEDIYTLSSMQQGMLFHWQYDKTSSAYFTQNPYRMHAQLEIEIAKKSLDELCKRYDVLRTVFIYEGVEPPLQAILKEREIDFYYRDVRDIVGKESRKKDAFVEDYLEKDRQRSFHLADDMLIRVSVIRLDETEYEFVWSFHHIIMDGWCTSLLVADYSEIYNSIMNRTPLHLPPVKPYNSYIRWLEAKEKKDAENYWHDYLAGYREKASVSRLETLETGAKPFEAKNLIFSFGKEKAAKLSELAKTNNVTLNTVFQAIWGIILAKYNDKRDVIFGAVVSGRPAELDGVERMVGCFINTVPIRIRYDEDTRFSQLLQGVQQNTAESEPYHYYTLAEIQAQSALKRDLIDHIMAFENYLIVGEVKKFSNLDDFETHIQSERLKYKEVRSSSYDFTILVAPQGDDITIRLNYNVNRYKQVAVERIAKQFEEIAHQVVEDSHVKIDEVSIAHDFIEVKTDLPEEEDGDFEF
ncbi:MAG: AMP-binding protein, partial [bacterium]|nr:AMP-binding protein [bacterium]